MRVRTCHLHGGQAPTPTLPRKRGREFATRASQLPPPLAGEGWGGAG